MIGKNIYIYIIIYIWFWTTKYPPNFQVRRSFHAIEVERFPKNNKIMSYSYVLNPFNCKSIEIRQIKWASGYNTGAPRKWLVKVSLSKSFLTFGGSVKSPIPNPIQNNYWPNKNHFFTKFAPGRETINHYPTLNHSISKKPLQTSHPPHPKEKTHSRLWWRFSVDSLALLVPFIHWRKKSHGETNSKLPCRVPSPSPSSVAKCLVLSSPPCVHGQ